MSSSDRVRALLEPVVGGTGHVLEDVTLTPAGRRRVLRVVVDLPAEAEGSLDLDAVAEVSRAVSEALDASDVLGGSPYVLEVTSPGVDRPLTEPRHWSRARGRLVRVETAPDAEIGDLTGRVTGTDADGVTLEVDGERRHLPWSALRRGRVQVEFDRLGETVPDTDTDTDTDTDAED